MTTSEDQLVGHLADLDNEFVVYEPGPGSLAFVISMSVSGTTLKSRMSWIVKLAIALNDCLNHHHEALGVDGYFFYSESARTITKADNFVASKHKFLLGPQLFFTRSTRSVEERNIWATATLREKAHISNLLWKSQILANSHPVLPIWSSSVRANLTELSQAGMRLTPFPAPKLLADSTMTDTTLDPEIGTLGMYIDILGGRIMLACAAEYRDYSSRMQDGHLAALMGDLTSGTLTPAATFARQHRLKSNDQVAGLVRAIGRSFDEMPEHTIAYSRARSWAPLALHLVATDPAAPTIQPPDVEVPVIGPRVQAFMSRQPSHPSTYHRATPRSPIRWSNEEDSLCQLYTEGYLPRELIDYLPIYRTVESLRNHIQYLGVKKSHNATALRAAREAKRG